MLSDSYIEQTVETKAGSKYYMCLIASGLLIIVGLLFFLLMPPIAALVIFAGGYLISYFIGDKNMEYEYTMTNGSVDIAVIYNASRRKELYQFDMSNAAMVVPYGSNRISNENFVKVRDYTSKSEDDSNKVSIVLEEDGKKSCVNLELNEKSLEHIKQFARHKCYDL